jgi:hypothetical protein
MAHDFVSDLENNKSCSGCLVFLHDTPITWIICKENMCDNESTTKVKHVVASLA